MDKNIKFCIPIIKKSKNEVIEVINRNRSQYAFFEVWLDHIDDIDLQFVESLKQELGEKLIILFRRQNLETPKMDWNLKVQIIQSVENSETLVDLDIISQQKELELIQKKQLKLKSIVSFHNYKQTPPLSELTKIVADMDMYNPYIYKVSTFCNNYADSVNLITLLGALDARHVKRIILGMGEYGMIVRMCALFLGNEFHFAPATFAEKSAPGQLTRGQLEGIAKIVSENEELTIDKK